MFQSFITFMILLLVVDSIWVLGARNLHMKVIQDVQNSKAEINPLASILFYLLAPIGYVLIIKKLAKSMEDAFFYGVILGMLMYGTFDLTNKAIFKNYPWFYTVSDMAWGSLCVGIVSALTFKINNNNNKWP